MCSKNVVVLCAFVVLGCNSPEEKTKVSEKEPLIMAKPSQMANLMNEMYAYNESIKQQIINGSVVTEYPNNFDKIHTAALTKSADRDLNFNTFAERFIEAEKAIFSATMETSKKQDNNAINACISCHNVKCVGPIPRIKKLLIP
jgi:hypothetical protein